MTQLTKLTTWAVRIIKDSIKEVHQDSIKEDHQDSIREEISLRAKVRDSILGIISTKEVHLISLPANILAYMRKPLGWKK